MSLLRRREMMEENRQGENIIYVDSGFLDANVRYNDPPIFNADFPDAWATTYVDVKNGDIVTCEELKFFNNNCRIRRYFYSGTQNPGISSGYSLKIINQDDRYARLLYVSSNAPIPNVLTVTHTNGTVTTYKIIDRR